MRMKKSKLLKIIFTIIYIIGIGLSVYYGVKFCLQSDHVSAPDAMIPFTDSEIAFTRIAMGCPLMMLSAVSMWWVYDLKHTQHFRRNSVLIFLPAVIDAIPFLFLVGFVIVLIIEAYLEVLGILP